MRIALVETKGRGGLLHYAVQLADALARRGHSVEVLVPRGHELQGHDGEAQLRPVLSRDVNVRRPLRNRGLYQLRRGLIAARLSLSMLKAVVMLRRGHYDAVILQWDVTFSIFAAASALLQRLPKPPVLAYVLHNVRPFNRWGGDNVFVAGHMRRLSRLLPRFDVVLVHGEQSLKEYTELYPPAVLAVIPHGDERLFGDQPLPPAGEERVLFFGDWTKVKGLPVLMEAFERLLQRRPQAKLTVAGTPVPSDFDDLVLRRWAAAHPDSVTLVDGYVPVDEVRSLFAPARVVCTPYIAGYQSGVVHLSMTMGRAVVTSDVGDLATAVGDGEAGLVVPVGDAATLAIALERVLTEPGLAEKLGAGGRRRAQTASSWETTAGLVEEALVAAAGVRVHTGRRAG